MPNFNPSGLLVPDRNIRFTLEEFRETFVDQIETEERRRHFDAYLTYSNALKKACGGLELVQWINGSFVTLRAQRPNDIDLVTFVDFETIDKLGNVRQQFEYPNSETSFAVDGYLVVEYPEGHAKYHAFNADRLYWMDKFDKTRRNNRGNKLAKGFVELVY